MTDFKYLKIIPALFNWKLKVYFFQIFKVGLKIFFRGLMLPMSQFEFETPALMWFTLNKMVFTKRNPLFLTYSFICIHQIYKILGQQ